MNWFSQTFSPVMGLLAATASGIVSSEIIYLLVTKREIAERVKAEIDKERRKQILYQEKARNDRIRREIMKWANPILGAVQDLEDRLDNILNKGGYLALDENYDDQINPHWSITYEFFMQSTLYFFAQYFAWVCMLEEELSFELFQSEQTKDKFFGAIRKVGSALGSFPHPALEGCSGEDKQVFKLQQRAIGELLILRSSHLPHCMSYTDFRRKLAEDETFSSSLKPLGNLLEKVAPNPPHNCRWRRLIEIKNTIYELKIQCRQLLTLPEENELSH